MEIPITNPHLSANVEDHSQVDDSFKQSGTTVNLGSGATYNQNCGNKREMSRLASTVIGIVFSMFCDFLIICFLVFSFNRITQKMEQFDREAESSRQRMEQRFEKQSKELLSKAKQGTIWILRDDIIKTIDFYETTKVITPKSYKRLKDEYEYYIELGGNHDVRDRWDSFTAKLYGLGEIKMVSQQPLPEQK